MHQVFNSGIISNLHDSLRNISSGQAVYTLPASNDSKVAEGLVLYRLGTYLFHPKSFTGETVLSLLILDGNCEIICVNGTGKDSQKLEFQTSSNFFVTLDYKNAYLLKIKSETALLFQATVGPMLPLPKRMDLDSPTIDPLVKQSINELCPAVIEKESAKVFRRRNEGYVTRLNIENLKEYVSTSSTDRARICLHDQDDSPLHEMFMVFDKSNFIKPAFHPKKDESILVLEGLVTILIFDSSGKIVSTIPLGDYNNSANRSCVFRVKQGEIHTLLVESDYAVLKETTQGPFRDNHTVFPNWDDNAKTKFDNFIHSNYRLS